MGKKDSKKSSGGGNKKGSSAASAASAAKKCTCDHPYQCNCGNRPERPSRGHKWDPATQQWTGKGHKQRGGGFAHTSAQSTVVTTVGRTKVEPWQRLPSVLLREICRSQKRPNPKFTSVGDSRGNYRYRVILNDAKSRDKDLILYPARGCNNEEQAKEEAALLALLKLAPTLPHERKLPEPYKTTWLNAIAAATSSSSSSASSSSDKQGAATGGKSSSATAPAVASKGKGKNGGGADHAHTTAGSSVQETAAAAAGKATKNLPSSSASATAPSSSATNGSTAATSAAAASSHLVMDRQYSSLSEKRQLAQQRRQARKAKIRKHEAKRMANRDHPVFMSVSIRKQIETLLRGGGGRQNDDARDEDDDEDDEDEDDGDDDEDIVRAYVVQRLHDEGFTRPQARRAYVEQKRRKAASSSSTYADEDEEFDATYEDCLQWLCIHLDEDELPEGFDPREGTLDVVVAPTKTKRLGKEAADTKSSSSSSSANGTAGFRENAPSSAAGGSSTTKDPFVGEFATRYGLSDEEASAIVAPSVSSKGGGTSENNSDVASSAREALWKAVCSCASGSELEAGSGDAAMMDEQQNREIAADEVEALQAIFTPEECTMVNQQSVEGETAGRTTITIALPDDDSGDVACVAGARLEIYIVDGKYPSTPPAVFISGNWKGQRKTHPSLGSTVHMELARFLSTLSRGDPMVYELYGYATSLLQLDTVLDLQKKSPPCLTPLFPQSTQGGGDFSTKGNEGSSYTSKQESLNKHSKTNSNTATKSPERPSKESIRSIRRIVRPRERGYFWRTRARDTPPAVAHPKLRTVLERARKGLPAAKARDEFLAIMSRADKAGRVVLVTGETGCGKTTQIPQFILEEAPVDAKIVVAQPRRLAATGVAARVANERGEESPGSGSVGYVVRGDSAMCNNTRLMFCTTGVLLRQLQSEAALECVTHIVVDEVHERHLDTDVLLGLLKELLPKTPHLRVVLMSATMDADRFAAYWGTNTPRMHIPGFTHPVQDYSLEHVLSATGYVPPKKGKKKTKYRYGNFRQTARKSTPWQDSEISEEEDDDDDDDGATATTAESSTVSDSGANHASQKPNNSIGIDELLERVDEKTIDYDLIAILVRHVLQNKRSDDDGSLLVFLPGAPEISKAEQTIKKVIKGRSIQVLPLHGGLQPRDQNLVFDRAPRGITKVILSTNVAETSITIPDCTIVIDTCKEKQSSYDPTNRMPMLIERFASRDSLKQRRGRAGRVRPGTCYKLISKSTLAKLPEHGEPEIRRCALDQTLLSLMFLGVEKGSGNFLSKLLDPPSKDAVDAAIFMLEKLGAVESSGAGERQLVLTPLGMHLAGIPAPPSVGKLLVMGSLMGCRSAALAIAAGMSAGRSPFMRVDVFNKSQSRTSDDSSERAQNTIIEEREKVFKSVGNSDHAMLAAVYSKWDSVAGGGGGKKRYCESLGLSFIGMRNMKQLVVQLDGALSSVGFSNRGDADRNAKSWRIVRACIVAALAPGQIVRVERPSAKYAETVEGAVEKDSVAKEFQFFVRAEEESVSNSTDSSNDAKGFITTRYHGVKEERVFMHPSSANFSVGSFSCPWLVYHEMVRTTRPYLRDATECSSYALLLFGGRIDVQAVNGLIVIDDWVRLSAAPRIGALIGGLRLKVDELLAVKVANPSSDIVGSVEMKMIVKLLMSDGLGQ